MCVVPQPSRTASTKVQGLTESSFSENGGKLFNALPKSMRNLTNVVSVTLWGIPKELLIVRYQLIVTQGLSFLKVLHHYTDLWSKFGKKLSQILEPRSS